MIFIMNEGGRKKAAESDSESGGPAVSTRSSRRGVQSKREDSGDDSEVNFVTH